MIQQARNGRVVEVQCALDIEQTGESFHAHAVPEGIDIRPGDAVQLIDAPRDIRFGDRFSGHCRATVTRAGPVERAWQHVVGLFELTELYEVGFQPKG